MQAPVTIEDLLRRKVLSAAQLVAGSAGINRRVRWVHILDVSDISTLISGNELVLTTGLGLRNVKQGLQTYIYQLFEAGAAGLCIELGTVINEISDEIITWADNNSFPIIVFPEKVRFIDITLDIHSFLLSRHHKILDDLEEIGKNLQNLTMLSDGTKQIVDYIQSISSGTVVFGRINQNPIIAGPLANELSLDQHWILELENQQNNLMDSMRTAIPVHWWKSEHTEDNMIILSQSVKVLNLIRGILAIIIPNDWVDDYYQLLLDKAVYALAQLEFRRASIQERQSFYEQDMVEELIRGEIYHSSLAIQMQQTNKPSRVVILQSTILNVIQPNTGEDDWYNKRSEIAMMIRMALWHYQINAFLAIRHREIVLILSIGNRRIWENQFSKAMKELESAIHRATNQSIELFVGIGSQFEAFIEAKQSYLDAQMAIRVSQLGSSKNRIIFYDQAGIHRWITLLHHHEQAHSIALNELKKIMEYDSNHKSDLMETLKVYLDSDRSVQKTADQLFIHRQTLYHRLGLLENLIDADLNDPISRLSLHISLYFYYHDTHHFK